ncbi:tetraspanin-31-like [Sinocyclocheilus rhinocerous]|uniref:tetraspanin-31-like n=1 Tax=Sinocyclocheilus rhinocerous TaxID=307959 RepID=UPI0007B8EAEA|nr:PREDICTED: tetraspanin-31-like [Sinocyclocheilus rhinocerous]
MVCGGFTCSKNALCSLNVVYMLVGLLLIVVAAWGKGFGIVSSIHIIGGVIAVGFFLLLIAIVGLIGAIHHHQVMLFFVSFRSLCTAYLRSLAGHALQEPKGPESEPQCILIVSQTVCPKLRLV